MGAGRRTQTFHGSSPPNQTSTPASGGGAAVPFLLLSPQKLASVIFGCTHSTFRECTEKLFFGLPFQHISYVKNVSPGMLLFLFNYSNRMIYGVYVAISAGALNINPYGWTPDGSGRTPFPAQVHAQLREQLDPVPEEIFRRAIAANYYNEKHFHFELDQCQTNTLLTLMRQYNMSVLSRHPTEKSKEKYQEEKPMKTNVVEKPNKNYQVQESKDNLYPKRKASAWKTKIPLSVLTMEDSRPGNNQEVDFCSNSSDSETKSGSPSLLMSSATGSGSFSTDFEQEATQNPDIVNVDSVMEGNFQWNGDELLGSLKDMINMNGNATIEEYYLRHADWVVDFIKLQKRNEELEKNQGQMLLELQALKQEVSMLSCRLARQQDNSSPNEAIEITHYNDKQKLDLQKACLLGGFDGQLCLRNVHAFSPVTCELRTLSPMIAPRYCAAAVELQGNIFIFGGGNGKMWFESVETYNIHSNTWAYSPPMNMKRGNLCGGKSGDRIFAIGGMDGNSTISEVEWYDIHCGKWIMSSSLLQERSCAAAAELEGTLYVLGGNCGQTCLSYVEMLDFREGFWTSVPQMTNKRRGLSAATLGGKLYAIGGHDGKNFLKSMEFYEPRKNCWVEMDMEMNVPRACGAVAVIGENIYMFGGKNRDSYPDKVEVFNVNTGWKLINSVSFGKRSSHASVVL